MENGNPKEEQEEQQAKDQSKTGVVPDNDLAGSDADKAYAEDGTFKQLDDNDTDQKGADADPDQ
ncbi:MAG: hypothetical protein EOO47_24045 [Flavobacterium sp.]|nr:MAG: hypothetical protein EOO47_24045 [Flavobacterium sp.]